MRILSRIGVGLTLLLAACGGKVGFEGTDDPDSGSLDGGADGGTDSAVSDDGTEPDAIPGGCGFGACSPGLSCSPDGGCNTCRCADDGSWYCTERACADAGPPPPPPCPASPPSGGCASEGQTCTYPNGCGGKILSQCSMGRWIGSTDPCVGGCPAAQPKAGTACSEMTKCGYSNGCGGTNTAWCDGKRWNLDVGPCTTPACPPGLPKPGTACAGATKCSYPSSCSSVMTYDTAVCDPSLGSWQIYYGECTTPPPPLKCPTSRPASGSTCSTGLSCQWDSGCGSILYGYCSSGAWNFKDPGCSPGCPSGKPVSGTACKMPSVTSCQYMVPGTSTCTSQCFCADDGRWACLTPPCATPAGG